MGLVCCCLSAEIGLPLYAIVGVTSYLFFVQQRNKIVMKLLLVKLVSDEKGVQVLPSR